MNVNQYIKEAHAALTGTDDDRILFIEKWVPVVAELVPAQAQQIAFLELEVSSKEEV